MEFSRDTSVRRRWICACSIAGFFATMARMDAQTISKADNTDPLNSGSSWAGGSAPGAANIAQWDSAITGTNITALGGNVSWLGIKVTNPAGAVTIDVGGTITLGNRGIDMSVATQDLTINAPVTIANGKQTWSVGAGRTLTLASVPTKPGQPGPNNAGVLQISTTGTIKLGTGTTNLITDNQGNPWATFGTNDWAALNGGTVVASTYTDALSALTAGVINNITGDITNAVTVDVQALRFADPTARTLIVSASGTSRTLTARGILVTADSGGGTIGGNTASSFIRPARTTIANTAFNVIQNSAADFTIGANISNGSSNAPTQIVKSGPGKLILTNNNGYTGGTTINEGTIQVGAGAAIGALGTGDVTNNGALVFNRSDVVTVANNIIGSGSVTQSGPGELILTSAGSSYSGSTNVNGGALTFTTLQNLGNGTAINLNGGALKWSTGNTVDVSARTISIGTSGGTLDTNGNNVTLSGSIGAGGAGALTKAGSGVLVLVSGNNYSGGTQVNGGSLLLANATGSATGTGPLAVNAGATLGGTGAATGTATINTSGTLAPGVTGVGTLTLAGLTLSAGSLLTFEFNPAARDFVAVSGANALTLNGGALSLLTEGTSTGWSTPGTYNLLSFVGSIQGSGIGALTVANPVAGFNYTLGTSSNFVTVTVAAAGLITNWTAPGGGSWGTSGNWSAGTPNQVDSTANFGSTNSASATVTLDGSKTVAAITFNSSNSYTIAPGTGGSLTIQKTSGSAQGIVTSGSHSISAPVVLNSDLVAEVAAGGTLNIFGNISGAKALQKTGAGTLTLSGNSSYSGGTQVTGGTLVFSSLASLGAGGLNISGATLRWSIGNTADISTRAVAIGQNGATLDTNGNDVILANAIGGGSTSGLTKAGAGSLTLAVDNAYSGATAITGGVVAINSNGALGDQTVGAGVTLNGGALRALAALTLDNGGINPRALSLGASGGTLDVPDFSVLNVPGLISGTGALTKSGAGTLILGNNGNNYTGGTVVAGGTLTLGSNVSFGNGGLGSGPIVFQGGTINSSYGANNTLVLPTTEPISVAAGQTGTLVMPNRFRLNGAISGAGLLNLTVSSTVTRSDLQNDFSNFTGTLAVTGSGGVRLGVQALASGEPNFNAAGLVNTNLSLDGASLSVQTNSGGNTIQVGALTSTGVSGSLGGTLNAGSVTWQVGAKNLDTVFQGGVTDGIAPTIFTKVGTGSLDLAGFATYTGATNVNSGTLIVSGSLSGSGTINLNGGEFRLGASNVVNDLALITASGGAFNANGFSETLGSLGVFSPLTLDLGAGASVLNFANSSTNGWFAGLNIVNWSGSLSGGGTDQLIFGSDSSGLAGDQLLLVQFTNPAGLPAGVYGARMLANGEIVAVPEPCSAALLSLGVALIPMRRRRH